jgi:hypothetical protein
LSTTGTASQAQQSSRRRQSESSAHSSPPPEDDPEEVAAALVPVVPVAVVPALVPAVVPAVVSVLPLLAEDPVPSEELVPADVGPQAAIERRPRGRPARRVRLMPSA